VHFLRQMNTGTLFFNFLVSTKLRFFMKSNCGLLVESEYMWSGHIRNDIQPTLLRWYKKFTPFTFRWSTIVLKMHLVCE